MHLLYINKHSDPHLSTVCVRAFRSPFFYVGSASVSSNLNFTVSISRSHPCFKITRNRACVFSLWCGVVSENVFPVLVLMRTFQRVRSKYKFLQIPLTICLQFVYGRDASMQACPRREPSRASVMESYALMPRRCSACRRTRQGRRQARRPQCLGGYHSDPLSHRGHKTQEIMPYKRLKSRPCCVALGPLRQIDSSASLDRPRCSVRCPS